MPAANWARPAARPAHGLNEGRDGRGLARWLARSIGGPGSPEDDAAPKRAACFPQQAKETFFRLHRWLTRTKRKICTEGNPGHPGWGDPGFYIRDTDPAARRSGPRGLAAGEHPGQAGPGGEDIDPVLRREQSLHARCPVDG